MKKLFDLRKFLPLLIGIFVLFLMLDCLSILNYILGGIL